MAMPAYAQKALAVKEVFENLKAKEKLTGEERLLLGQSLRKLSVLTLMLLCKLTR